MKVSVNEESDSQPSPLTVGETVVSIKVLSADGSNSQVITQTATVLATFFMETFAKSLYFRYNDTSNIQ